MVTINPEMDTPLRRELHTLLGSHMKDIQADEVLADLWPTLLPHLKTEDGGLGATGQFPDGKTTEADEGELRVMIRDVKGQVRIQFGKSVAWMQLPPAEALQFALTVLKYAFKIGDAGG